MQVPCCFCRGAQEMDYMVHFQITIHFDVDQAFFSALDLSCRSRSEDNRPGTLPMTGIVDCFCDVFA